MTINHLQHVPKDWLEEKMDSICAAWNKIKNLYWVRWEGGYVWKFGKKPHGDRWQRPTIEQTIERQAIFDGVHKTLKRPKEWKRISYLIAP